MSKIKGIYAAGMSILNEDLSLNIEKTILHSEKIIDQGCHGVAIFGSTGQAQLIPVAEKVSLLNKLSLSRYKKNFLIGTGMNSLGETINLMKISFSLGFDKFLIMPPAYYKYADADVIKFYSKIVEALPKCEIVLYNFEKLCGYKFSIECIEELVKMFPDQIIGVTGLSITSSLGEEGTTGDAEVIPTGQLLTSSIGNVNITAWSEVDLGVSNTWAEVDRAA